MVISEGSTRYGPVRIKCVCMWQETYINNGLKTQGFIFSWTRDLDQSWYVFPEAVRDSGSVQLSTSSSLECGPHLHGPRWPPGLQPSHSHSRRKGRRRAYFLPFKKGWGNRAFFSRQSCAQLKFRRFITKKEGENGYWGRQLEVSLQGLGTVV